MNVKDAARESSTRAGYNSDIAADAVGQAVYEIAFIAGVKWQAEQSPWVSVKERLPKEDELVLCRMVSNGAIVSGYVFVSPDNYTCVSTSPDFEFEDYGGYVLDIWMPIPKFNE